VVSTIAIIIGAYIVVGGIMAARSMSRIYSPDRHTWRREALGLSAFEAERRTRFFASAHGFLTVFAWAQFGWPVVAGAVMADRWRERRRVGVDASVTEDNSEL
jgi:hypothetical protein